MGVLGTLISGAAVAVLAIVAPASAAFEPGASTLGDPILPQVGNGGYDVLHYDIDLRYDPVGNRFEAPTSTTIRARATQGLSRFSLDFQPELTITSVAVDGLPAAYERRRARPRLGGGGTQPFKLLVTPRDGIPRGQELTVTVSYEGSPKAVVDAEGGSEGWVRACSPAGCDGSFTVNEPWGAQSWIPSNNHPSDKASATTRTTVPAGYVALGAGELLSQEANRDGTVTWTWQEPNPTATYLLTGTVGRFDLERSEMPTASGAALPILNAIDTVATPGQRTEIGAAASAIPAIVDFMSARLGRYPFGSIGLVADWVSEVGYALENQTKPHFAGNERGPHVPVGLLAHEIAHQWVGDSVSPRRWNAVWFNEGWATLLAQQWMFSAGETDVSPGKLMRIVYGTRDKHWRLAPARLDHDPRNLFDQFAVYERPAAMLEGLRRIIGRKRFRSLARRIGREHRFGNIGRDELRAAAIRASGFGNRRRAAKLGRYLDQWLLWERRPRLSWRSFR